jgi:hypothetical protein
LFLRIVHPRGRRSKEDEAACWALEGATRVSMLKIVEKSGVAEL